LRIDVLTLFPQTFTPLYHSIPLRAQNAGLVQVLLHDLREWGRGNHRMVDDKPYGGGPGMVMACPPLFEAIEHIHSLPQSENSVADRAHVIYLSPQGKALTQARVLDLARLPRLLLVCGHYEGIDERVIELAVDEEISVGDFVVSGGELPAMLLAEAVIRVLPGAIAAQSVVQDSFYAGLLDHPHYTRPPEFRGLKVPEVLLSGDHQKIADWRRRVALERTRARRPDLLP
jgi:tRNA (guanine37-N1)-methyltransferase